MIIFQERFTCPGCKSAGTQLLIELPFTEDPVASYLRQYYGTTIPVHELGSGRYRLQECQNCGLIYQQQILNNIGMAALYGDWINAEVSLRKKQTADLAVRVGYARQSAQVIKAVRALPLHIRVLDFGMGWGTWLLMAKAFGMQTDGLEIAPDRVAHAHENGLRVVTSEEIQDASYDFINAEQVLEHVSDPADVLASCYRWLKPGGFLRVAVPDGKQIARRIQDKTWRVAEMPSIPLEHINVFTHASLSHLARQEHFKVVHPPLVLPMLGFSISEAKHWFGLLAYDLAIRLRLAKSTTLWLRK